MKKITLTQGKYALVSDKDFKYLNQFKWYYKKKKTERTGYAARKHPSSNNTVFMHQLILKAKNVDHKDGDGLNNQRHNIRIATKSQNQWNRGKSKNNTTGFKGVSTLSGNRRKKFFASLQVNYEYKYIGAFETALEAHEAYIKEVKKYHGRFARW